MEGGRKEGRMGGRKEGQKEEMKGGRKGKERAGFCCRQCALGRGSHPE